MEFGLKNERLKLAFEVDMACAMSKQNPIEGKYKRRSPIAVPT